MGNQLPKTKKNFTSGSGNDLSYGLCSMQGWRRSMEDAHCAEISLPEDWKKWSFFAIFDGHGGKEVSTYCAKHLLVTIMKTEPFKSCNDYCRSDPSFTGKVQEGITEAFLNIDAEMKCSRVTGKNMNCGTTVISVLVSSTHYYIANLGDSKGVLSNAKELRFVTNDHKPDNEFEKQRIERAGGLVIMRFVPRINGCLSVSRALGDYAFKQGLFKSPVEQMVSPEPVVHALDRYVDDEFLVLACDGIWDVLKPRQLCDYIRYMLHIVDDIEYICKSIIDTCFYKGSRDNMSVLVVLLPGAPKISEMVIEQDKKIHSILQNRVKEIIRIFGNMKIEKLMKILSDDAELQLEPALKGSPFEKSFCFQYCSVKMILLDILKNQDLLNLSFELMRCKCKHAFS